MSAQSGITCADELKQEFADAKDSGSKRAIKVKIENEKLVCKETVEPTGTLVEDLANLQHLFDEKEPCYVLARRDVKGESGYTFVMMAHVPDKSPVRQKMLYASTREALKRELGSMCFVDEMFGTIAADFNQKGYESHLEHEAAANPLTEAEEYYKESRQVNETTVVAPTKSYMTVQFKVDDNVNEQLTKLLNDQQNFVVLKIDQEKEAIECDGTEESLAADKIVSHILETEPRFYVFRYKHRYTDDADAEVDGDSTVLIYCCPGKTAVKSRMTYATVKPFVLETISNVGITLAKKLEIFSPSEFSETLLMEELHPKKVEKKATFAKPTRVVRARTKPTGSGPTSPTSDA